MKNDSANTPILSVVFQKKNDTKRIAREVADRCKEKFPGVAFTVSDGIIQSYVEGPPRLDRATRLAYKAFADAVLHEIAKREEAKGLPR